MAEAEEKVEGEVKEAKPAKPIAQLAPIERRPELGNLLEIFAAKTGMEQQQAIPYLTKLMEDAGASPETNLEEAARFAGNLVNVLQLFPDLPLTAQTKDAAMSAGLSKMVQRATKEPEADERMGRILDKIMPYFAVMPMVREMMRASGGGSVEGEGKSPEVEALKAELNRMREDMKEEKFSRGLEERFSKLDQRIEKLTEAMAAPKPEEGKKLGEILGEKFEKLEKTVTEERKAKEFEVLSEKLGGKLDALNESIRAQGQGGEKDTLKQASEVMSSMGEFFKGFGGMAESLGYEKESAIDVKDKLDAAVKLGHRALKTVDTAITEWKKPAPERQVVKTIPVETPQPAPAQPAPAPETPETPAPKPETPPPAEGA